MTQRYKITVEYDGTDLLGWQKQLDGPSAQEFLEKAVEAFCQEKTEVYGAGRTDAGVHERKNEEVYGAVAVRRRSLISI